VGSTGLVEEAISSELVLVDRELAFRARAELPDPPWLLPVLAELPQAETATPPPRVATPRLVTQRRAVSRVAAGPRRRSLARHIAATAAGICLLFVLAALGAWAADVLSTSEEPTFVTTAVEQVATPRPSRLSAVAGPRRQARRSQRRGKPAAERAEAARRSVSAKARPKGTNAARRTRSRPATIASALAPKPAARPRALANTQRVFSWRRHAAAIYYQFYFQRGATTIYQARTVKLSAALPARLKLRPGTYHVLVRPAIPSDAGIILGAAIVEKTMRV
jgi:hypothetical protein